MTRGRRAAALAILGLGVLCLGLGYNAIISRSQLSIDGDSARLEASSIDLTTGGADAILSARGMLPGDAVTSAITITNSGRQPMTYAMSLGLASASGAALAGALVLTIKTVGSSCADFDGTTLFDGPLDQAAFGSQANGRPLPAATAEILCFQAALPFATGNALQGAATTVTLTFGADLQAAVR
jgi:hypothetical protein